MHDRLRMIQRRETAAAPPLLAAPAPVLVHPPHGPGIAIGPSAYHVTPEGSLEQERQGCARMTARGADKAKDILNAAGATLVQVAGGRSATRWIVPSSEAFHEDESPQMTGCTRDLALELPRRSFIFPPVSGRQRLPSTRRSASKAGRYRCALLAQAFTAELDNAVF